MTSWRRLPVHVDGPAAAYPASAVQCLSEPERIPRDTDYSAVIESDVPVVVQHARLDSRRAALALLSTRLLPTAPTSEEHRIVARDSGKELLDRAFEGLERETPDRVTRAIRWLRAPHSRWLRLPLGILCIAASAFWFLPVIGLELLPIGLLLIAQDVPSLQRPVGRMMLWLEARWAALRRRWQRARGRTSRRHS